MTKTNDFDERALTWDNDPMKVARAGCVADYIKQSISLTKGMKGLEYGCGTGLLSFNLHSDLKSIKMADNSDGMIAVLKDKVKDSGIDNMFPINLDLTADSIIDEKFDIIYTSMTLHHIIEVDVVLEKFSEMLNVGSYLCIADLDEEDGSFHGKDFEGHKGFNRGDLEQKLENLGLNTIHYKFCFEMKREHSGDKVYNVFVLIAKKAN
ncbi:MAG: class I SAM-dependent methyltransferase [Clostridia bacterium]